MQVTDSPSPLYAAADCTMSRFPSISRVRPPLPHGPRIPNKPQNNLSPISCSSPSLSTSRLNSPTLSLPLITQSTSADSIPPSYAESPDIRAYSPVLALPPESRTVSDAGVQVSPSPNIEGKLVVKVIPKTVALVLPPQINFDSVPISFKGLTLEAAQWTFTSAELQEIVSRAIRMSARESFIRVLPIETLDKLIVDECERLATLKLTTQSQYRFHVHRRTMLLQAINSSASATPHNPSTISSLAGQLSETTAQCDRLMEELLRISDQQNQIAKVLDLHSASALAIALRKINKSYERRINELRKAQDKIDGLEAELEEAWKEAEKVAKEADDLEAGMSDDEDITMHTAHMVGVIGKAVATEAKLIPATEATDPPVPKASEAEDGAQTQVDAHRSRRWSRVAAAKRRSQRTSVASLRLTKRSLSRAGRGSEEKLRPPPVPNLPSNIQESSFLDLDSIHTPSFTAGSQHANSAGPKSFPIERPHPFSASAVQESIPSIWLLAESPSKSHSEERDRVQSMLPFPRVRHDSAARSSSEYSHLRPRQARHSVPVPPSSPPIDLVPGSTARCETP